MPSESLREHLSISALDLSSCSYSEYRIPDLAQRSSHTYNQMNAFMSHYTQCHRSLSGNPASSREEHQRFHFLSIVKFIYMVVKKVDFFISSLLVMSGHISKLWADFSSKLYLKHIYILVGRI